jgi:triosephosphate isomerase
MLHVQLRTPLQELREAIRGLSVEDMARIIVAYEPIWAISSNKAAQPATGVYANIVAQAIRAELAKQAGHSAESVPILYGGSVKPDNAHEFLIQDHINGLLVGGASLKVKDFLAICRLVD